MNGHLDAGLGACALEDDVKAVGHIKVSQSGADGILCAAELVIRCLGLVRHGKAVRVLREALLASKVETGLVDVDRDDVSSTIRLGKGTGQKANGANAEDEDGGGSGGGEASPARGVYEDGERLGKCRLVECAVVR